MTLGPTMRPMSDIPPCFSGILVVTDAHHSTRIVMFDNGECRDCVGRLVDAQAWRAPIAWERAGFAEFIAERDAMSKAHAEEESR